MTDKEPLIRILSLGAGVQSSTMALMADQGAFGEKPTAAIFADTGWEPRPVIDHLNYLKSKLSFPVYICKAGNLNEDILKATDNGKFVAVPFFTINEKGKKAANQAAIAVEENLENTFYGGYTPSRQTEGVYGREYGYQRKNRLDNEVYAYPSDINTDQDHLKIQKWEYVRPNVNQSKPNQGGANQDVNVAGDSVKGSKLQGSVLLPMPKVVDVNGADWGENKITAFGLGALGASKVAADVLNLTPGLTEKERTSNLEALNKLKGEGQFGSGFGSKEERENFRKALGSAASVSVTSGIAGLAGNALGTQISPDTFLARTGGAVLNPNAEMLFQGPVIRDFNFSFLMIARSEKEGSEIRKIIKWFKKGMAPKFRNTTLIKSPDIFTLEYKNAGGLLKTVNRFNPGGLALTTVNIDYAPSGYWSAYRDSQPVSVKMDLNFTELRPIYQKDQEDDDVFRGLDSVGF